MYSEQFMHYLYSYNMPKKEDDEKYTSGKNAKDDAKQHLRLFKNAYASVPIDFHHK